MGTKQKSLRTPLVLGKRADSIVSQVRSGSAPWKIIIVDDDDEILAVSRMVLRDFVFDGRALLIITGSSGVDAKRLLAENPDTAILMIDVVMETDHAGLDVVRHVREKLGNTFVRIILRTGQPGQAPERQVIIDYDINDYKEKTELTSQKLITTLVSALRGFRDLKIIESSRRGLEQIVRSSASLFEPRSLVQFAQGVLQQVTSLLNLDDDSLYLQSSGFAAVRDSEAFRVVAGTGCYQDSAGMAIDQVVSPEVSQKVAQAARERRSIIDDEGFLGYYRASGGMDNVVYVRRRNPANAIDNRLLEVLSTNLAVAFDNVHLHNELKVTQEELIHTLSEVVETRSQETGHHVDRVGAFSALLGEMKGLGQDDVDLLSIAAPMHDLGKIGISDAILCKSGRYDEVERTEMMKHPDIGYAILKTSGRSALQAAAIICRQHHEYWDGSGYPQGLSGDAIHPFGRIVALADVFDALTHDRIYKQAWPLDKVVDYIREQRGKQFEGGLVDLFLNHLDEFTVALSRYQ